MIASNLHGVEFITINTDLQVLESSLASVKIQIGKELTRGLGAGSNPGIGRQAAIDDRDAIMECLDGCDMVFITAGMAEEQAPELRLLWPASQRNLGRLLSEW